MKIEIDYNGAFAVCNIELMDEPGKMVNFNDADTTDLENIMRLKMPFLLRKAVNMEYFTQIFK